MIGIDLTKNVLQVHGYDQFGTVVLRKKRHREGVMDLLQSFDCGLRLSPKLEFHALN